MKTVEAWKSLDHRIINLLENESHTLQKTEGRNGLAIHRNRSVALHKNRRSVENPGRLEDNLYAILYVQEVVNIHIVTYYIKVETRLKDGKAWIFIETAEQLSIKTVEVWKSLDHRIINILEDESHTLQKTEGRKGLAIHRNRCVALLETRRIVIKAWTAG